MQLTFFLFVLVICGCFMPWADSAGMWGSRKKREEQEVQPGGGFEASRRAAAANLNSGNRANNAELDILGAQGGLGSKKVARQIKTLINSYIKIMEQAVSTPEFKDTVTPESIRRMLDNVPGLSSNPQIAAIIDSPDFTDPEKLMDIIQTGIEAMKTHTDAIVDLLSNPEQMKALVDQLPVEYQDAARGLMNGDTSAITNLLDALPLAADQKQMVQNLISGNKQGLQQNLKSVLGDSDKLEETRQHMLEHPEMLEAFGLDPSILTDKARFAEMMEQGLDAFADLAKEEGADAGDEDALASKLFGSSAAA